MIAVPLQEDHDEPSLANLSAPAITQHQPTFTNCMSACLSIFKALLIFFLLTEARPCIAQSFQLPVVDLNENLKLPPWPSVTDSLHRSHTEVIFVRQHDDVYDTAQLLKYTYSSTGRLLERLQYDYLDPLARSQARFRIKVGRYIKEGQLKRYVYNAAGQLTDELTYTSIPENSYYSYLLQNQLFAERVVKEVATGAEKDKERATARIMRYADSITKVRIPGYTRLTDSQHTAYNSFGFPDSTEGSAWHYRKVYSYRYDKRGRPIEQRWQYLSVRKGEWRFNNAEVHQFTYLPDGRTTQIRSYKVYADTVIDITVPRYLVRDQSSFYNGAGNVDSIIYHLGYKSIKEINTYEGGQLAVRTLLDSSSARGYDTLMERMYVYNDQHRLCTFFQVYHFSGKTESIVQLNYFYNTAGLPVEGRQYNQLAGSGNQPVYRQHLIFYNSPDDAQTAARGLQQMPRQKPVVRQPGHLSEEIDSHIEQPRAIEPPSPNEIFRFVEQMPEFKGDLQTFLKTQLRYPPAAKKAGIEGRVVVQFVVATDGSIHDAIIVRKLNPALDAEALRVVKAMPRWKSGKQSGRSVAVYYTIPITFSLQ